MLQDKLKLLQENAWAHFGNELPRLGTPIDVTAGNVQRLNLGKVTLIQDLGNGWIGFNTENTLGAAVRPTDQWRETI